MKRRLEEAKRQAFQFNIQHVDERMRLGYGLINNSESWYSVLISNEVMLQLEQGVDGR